MQKISTFFLTRRHYLLLLLITLIAYWPLTFHIFSLKNDALVYFLPYRYHISEAIQNGHFPWWNPYLYTGLPLHSDIQSGVWNPVVMFISLFTQYNLAVLQWELLFYLFIAAAGMFKLVKEFNNNAVTSVIAATAYLCCGFMTDSGSIIPWITSAAYLPFVFLYFYRLLNKPLLKTALKFTLALSLLLTAGYPSFFIYCLYVLLTGFIFWAIRHYKEKSLKPVLAFTIVAAIIFLLIVSPAVLSWWDFFGYYDRGNGASLERIQTNAFPPFSSISYLLPSAVSRSHPLLQTDLTARNASTGIFILVFFLLALAGKLKPVYKFIGALILFSFLFSLGDATPVREWCHRFLPFMNSFRHPASMRIFTTIGIILIAAPVLNTFLVTKDAASKKIKILAAALIILLFCILTYYIIKNGLPQLIIPEKGKALLDKLSYVDIAVMQGIIQIAFISFFLLAVWKGWKKYIPALVIANAIIFCWMALPFTFISQVKTSVIDQYIASSPKNYPLTEIAKPVTTTGADPSTVSPLGQEKFYNKTISIQDHVITPTISTHYINFLKDTILRKALNNYPFVYFSDSTVLSTAVLPDSGRLVLFERIGRTIEIEAHTTGTISVVKFEPNKIELEIAATNKGLLNLFQQYHHGWRAFEDNIEIPVYRTNRAFMSVPVSAGKHTIKFKLGPHDFIRVAVYVSSFTLLLISIFFILQLVKKKTSE
ncbi:MAG: YfhO family protein [Chitinophagales bacterium]|nr:YfhO family protein [Chitinophagales bacterium]